MQFSRFLRKQLAWHPTNGEGRKTEAKIKRMDGKKKKVTKHEATENSPKDKMHGWWSDRPKRREENAEDEDQNRYWKSATDNRRSPSTWIVTPDFIFCFTKKGTDNLTDRLLSTRDSRSSCDKIDGFLELYKCIT